MKKRFAYGMKIDYCGNIYEYIDDDHGYMIFQDVNSDNYIKIHCTNFSTARFDVIEI